MLRATLDSFCPSRCTAGVSPPASRLPACLPAGEGRGGASGPAAPAPPGHVTPRSGPRPASGKVPAARAGRGRAEGRKSTDGGRAAENKDGPTTAAPRPPGSRAPPDPQTPQQILVFQPLRDPRSGEGVRGGGLWLPSPPSPGRAQTRRAHSPPRRWLRVHACRPGGRTRSSPIAAFRTAEPRNPSSHSPSPQSGDATAAASPPRGRRGQAEAPWSRGEGPSPGAQRLC